MKYSVLFYVRDFDLAKNDEERAKVIEDVKQRISTFERERDDVWNEMTNRYRQKEEVLKELLDDIEDYRKLLRFLRCEAAKRILFARMKGAQQ